MTRAEAAEAIAQRLQSLDDLHAIAKMRDAEPYVVLGRFVIEREGFSDLSFTFGSAEGDDALARALPRVVSLKDLGRVIPGALPILTRATRVPTSADRCDVCGHGWKLETCHEVVLRRPSETVAPFRHIDCHAIAREVEETKWHRRMVDEAGLGAMPLRPTENGYWRPEDRPPPWCLIVTPRGIIRFGWRKRVVEIDWSDVVKRATSGIGGRNRGEQYQARSQIEASYHANTLFPTDESTKGPSLIHAWNETRVVEVLRKLSERMQVGAFKPPAPTP